MLAFIVSLVAYTDPAEELYGIWERNMGDNRATKLRTQYHFAYAQHLAPYRTRNNVTLLEIGANTGDSLYAWSEYFREPGATIWGMRYGVSDSRMKKCLAGAANCAKVHIHDGDQSSARDLQALVAAAFGDAFKAPAALANHKWRRAGYDVIIDDGSHVPAHILFTFTKLFPMLRPGGVYVIEDNAFSYADKPTTAYGYRVGHRGGIGRPTTDNAIERFKALADIVNREECFQDLDIVIFSEAIDRAVFQVAFVSGLVFVWKKTAAQQAGLAGIPSLRWTSHANGPALQEYKRFLEAGKHVGVGGVRV